MKFGLLEIIILGFFLLIASTIYFFLFRTKKDLIIVAKAYEDNVIWDTRRSTWETGSGISTIWLSNILHPGMKEKDALGNSVAELISIRKYDNRPDSPTVYLTLRIKTVFTSGSKTHTYKGKNVLVGSTIQLNLDDVFVQATVVNTESDKNRYPLVKLVLETQLTNPESTGIMPHVADSLEEGAKIKDNKNQDVLTIIKKTTVPAQKLVTTDLGQILLSQDPFRKDVFLTLEVQAYKINNHYYFFDDIPILIDKTIPVHLKNISIFPVITSIKEI